MNGQADARKIHQWGLVVLKCFVWVDFFLRIMIILAAIFLVHEGCYWLSQGEWPKQYFFTPDLMSYDYLEGFVWIGKQWMSSGFPVSLVLFCVALLIAGISYVLRRTIVRLLDIREV
jgi:hypothetical protein